MKIFTYFILFCFTTFLFGQNDLQFNKDHRFDEAQRKASALEKQKAVVIQSSALEPRGYDVNYYGLTLDIYPDDFFMSASVELKATSNTDNLSVVWLDFNNYLAIDSISAGLENLVYTHENGTLNVTLEKTLSNDDEFSFTIYYHGRTDFGGSSVFGQSFGHVTDIYGRDHIWSLSEPYGARDWWPCKDTALDKADSMDIVYVVPEGMSAASNGNLISELTTNGRTTFHWKVGYPIATYLVSIAAYDYSRYDDFYIAQNGDTLPIMFFVAPENLANSKENFALVNDMIDGFAQMYGEYPFMGEKYGHAEAAIFGGMEHQTMTTLGPIQFSQGFYGLGLIAHELAHMWWGDMITCASFQDIWLNEGFATYSEALIQEKLVSKQAYKDQMVLEEYYGPGTIFVEDTTDPGRIFNGNLSYSKAGYVLHMLRGVVGNSIFFEILNAWYNNPTTKYKAAYTEDFQKVCEDVSGLSLGKFFQQWIYGEYYPVYAHGFKYDPVEGGYNITLSIDQVQENTGLFWMPIDVRVVTKADTIDFAVWDSLASQSFNLFVENEPLVVELDPDKWILKETRSKLIEPRLDKGILLFNGISWRTNGLKESFESRAFWGDAPITFWDYFEEPNDGYPSTLPAPLGNGEIPSQTLGNYSTVIWLGNNSGGDLQAWEKLPIMDYLNSGGNIILLTKTGQSFINNDMREYLGIIWDESELLLVKNFLSTYSGLQDIGLVSPMAFIGLFDTTTTSETSTLIFKSTEEFEAAKGAGVWSHPSETGDFVYIAARPWLLEANALKANMTHMLSNYMGESITSIEDDYKDVFPDNFEISNIYPNPFNPITTIVFTLPRETIVTLSVYDITGKKVENIIKNTSFKAGKHSYKWDASSLASGLYFFQMESDNAIQTRKAILMK